MEKKYINSPYENEYNLKIINKREKNNKSYARFTSIPAFMGTSNVIGDKFKINNHDFSKLNSDANYFEIDNENSEAEIKIDFKHRLDIMQQNLGIAILRYYIDKTCDFKAIDFYIDENKSYVEIDSKDIAFAVIDNLEELSNYAINANLKVKNNDGEIFIDGLSKISYDGPALSRTGEVSLLKISNIEKTEAVIRLNVLCGNRAFKDYKYKSKTLNNIMSYLNLSNNDDLFKFIKKIKSNAMLREVPTKIKEETTTSNEKNSDLAKNKSEVKKDLKESENIEKNNNLILNEIKSENKNIDKNANRDLKTESLYKDILSLKNIATNVDGIKYIYKVIRDMNFNKLKEISQNIMKEKDYIQVYGLVNGSKAQFLVLRSQNLNINLKDIANNIEKTFKNIKASGNLFVVQGNCDTTNLASIMEGFLLEIKKHFEK